MARTQRQPGSVKYSPDKSYGIVFLQDGRRVLFGEPLGPLLLFIRHGDPVVTIGAMGRMSMDNSLVEFAIQEGPVSVMSADDLGFWEHTTSLIQPHESLYRPVSE